MQHKTEVRIVVSVLVINSFSQWRRCPSPR